MEQKLITNGTKINHKEGNTHEKGTIRARIKLKSKIEITQHLSSLGGVAGLALFIAKYKGNKLDLKNGGSGSDVNHIIVVSSA